MPQFETTVLTTSDLMNVIENFPFVELSYTTFFNRWLIVIDEDETAVLPVVDDPRFVVQTIRNTVGRQHYLTIIKDGEWNSMFKSMELPEEFHFLLKKRPVPPQTIKEYAERKLIDLEAFVVLSRIAKEERPILITGRTGSGKTTLLEALLRERDEEGIENSVVDEWRELSTDLPESGSLIISEIANRQQLTTLLATNKSIGTIMGDKLDDSVILGRMMRYLGANISEHTFPFYVICTDRRLNNFGLQIYECEPDGELVKMKLLKQLERMN